MRRANRIVGLGARATRSPCRFQGVCKGRSWASCGRAPRAIACPLRIRTRGGVPQRPAERNRNRTVGLRVARGRSFLTRAGLGLAAVRPSEGLGKTDSDHRGSQGSGAISTPVCGRVPGRVPHVWQRERCPSLPSPGSCGPPKISDANPRVRGWPDSRLGNSARDGPIRATDPPRRRYASPLRKSPNLHACD